MIRNRLGKKRWNLLKYAGLTVSLALVCTLVFFVLWKTDVFGKFQAEEPYVVGDAQVKSVIVTSEGSNQKGKDGSGATPCSTEVPPCTGKKGTETNPFVVLEIVPDKSQQQLAYLGQEEGDSRHPLDLLKIGIEFSKNKEKALTAMDSGMFESHELGRWLFHKKYSVYKVGEEEEKENIPFAYIDKLYTLEFTDEDVAKVSEDNTSGKCFGQMLDDIKELSDNYPELFKEDSEGKKIPKIAREEDRYNWKVTKEVNKVLQEFQNPGYLLMVKPGEGDFGFSDYTDLRNWRLTKTGTKADRWIYVKDEDDLAEKYPDHPEYLEYLEKYDYNNCAVQSTKFVYKENGVDADFSQERDQNNVFDLVDSPELTGLVYKIDEWSRIPSLVSYKYTFDYYGIKNNNILKRSLFTFRDQEDFDNFHMQVIYMTPAELNKLSKLDDEYTVDMIERADMFYIQSGDFDGNTVNDTALLEKMYYEYVDTEASKPDENITFYENDLEWSLCQKIIERQSSVKTLPLVFNQMVGKLLEGGISRNKNEIDVHMYLTGTTENKRTCIKEKGSRNNLAKLYLISIQFDLLARKKNDEGFKRTFMEDIYPNIKTISLPEESGVVKGTATTTGYYDGSHANPIKLCTCDSDDDFKKRVYYLWNGYTFFPQDMDEDPLSTNVDDEKILDKFIEQGYLPTIKDSNNKSQPFQNDILSHQSGSDGNDDKNVTIVHDSSNSNTNHSSFLGDKGDSGDLANTMLEIIFQIMNNQDKAVRPVTVTAVEQRKMYVKIADEAVMIDQEEGGKSKGDKDIYVKVRFWNNDNNRSGQVKEIRLVNEAGEPVKNEKGEAVTFELYTDKTFTKECDLWKNLYTGEEMKKQYIVSVDNAYLEGYVKFKLRDWKQGYNTLEFDTVGWIYYTKKGSNKGKLVSGNVVTTPISIIGKPLFDLE